MQTQTQTQTRETLLQLLVKPDGKIRTVYSILRHVSASGMTRYLSFHIADDNGEIYTITHLIAEITGHKLVDKDGRWTIKHIGAGYDAGYETVYQLSKTLFGDGYKIPHRWL